MPQDTVDASAFSPDVIEFLSLLEHHGVRYLIVGGEAVIYYGYTRLTGDVDFFYDREPRNADRLFSALSEFWGGTVPGISNAEELLPEDVIVQFGRPPNRIDLLSRIDGVSFEDAWTSRKEVKIDGVKRVISALFIGMDSLIDNKRAIGRPKDLEDLAYLEKAQRNR